MKLASKLIFSVVTAIVLILAIDGFISFKHQRDLFEADMHHDIRVLGLAIRPLVIETWNSDGRERAWKIIEDANQAEPSIDVRWVWLNAPLGQPHAPHVSTERLEPIHQDQLLSLTIQEKGKPGQFYAYFPITINGEQPGALEFHESLAELDNMDHHAMIKIISLTAALVFFSAIAALLLGIHMIGRPLEQMVDKMRRIGTGDFSGNVEISGHDELDELAMGMNGMCADLTEAWDKVQQETEARIAAMEQLRHEDRLKTVGRLSSGIAHEMGTPLNVISGYAGMIASQNLSLPEASEVAETIKTQSERIAGIIRQLLDFARRKQGRREKTDLNLLVKQTLDLITPLAPKQDIQMQYHPYDHPLKIQVNNEQIKQVLLNLMTNAMQAMPHGGQIHVGITVCDRPENRPADTPKTYVDIWIQDEGEGITPEDLDHIFEPFYTTKDTGQGTGLGLSITEGIIQEHGGWIDVESQVDQGSCFSVYLPMENHDV